MSWIVAGVIFGIGIGLVLRPVLDWWMAWHDYRRAASRIDRTDAEYRSIVSAFENRP
jgi:hypothetical protein